MEDEVPSARKTISVVSAAAITVLAALWPASAGSAAAAPAACGPRADVLAQLARQYDEVPKAVGLANGGNLVEVLASSDGATWTIILTSPKGISCLVAAGEAWRELNATGPTGPEV
jgi:hypothetical protein